MDRAKSVSTNSASHLRYSLYLLYWYKRANTDAQKYKHGMQEMGLLALTAEMLKYADAC
jgi:hypothetical protein